MARRVQSAQLRAGNTHVVAVGHRAKASVRVGHPPEYVIGGVKQNRRVERLAQFGSHRHVIVVSVRAHHRHHIAPAHGRHDRLRGVGGVEDHDVGIVPDDPDVVVDIPTATVEFEGSVGDYSLDRALNFGHHNITTERSTLPACIL